MVARFLVALLANALFPVVGGIVLTIEALIRGHESPGLAGWIVGTFGQAFILAYLALTAAALSTAIFVVGGHFNAKVALGVAALVGSALLFHHLSGDAAQAMRFRLSVPYSLLLAVAYAGGWAAAGWSILRGPSV